MELYLTQQEIQNTGSAILEKHFIMKGGSLIDGENYITQ